MNNYNYADEIIKDDYDLYQQTDFVRIDPREKIVNEQDQDITLNIEDDKNESDEGLQAFEEGLRNDNINTEEKKDDKEKQNTPKKR